MTRRARRAVLLLALVSQLALACRGEEPVRLDGTAPSLESLANASYAGIYEEPVRLEDGRWQGEPFVPGGAARPTVWLLEGLSEVGDLNGDGAAEAVVLLAENSGGSGSYVYVAAMGMRGGAIANLGTSLVGDRVQVRALRLASDSRIELDVVQAGPEDPACCPTQKATRTWKLEDDGLVQTSSEVTGTISVADLTGVEWVLTHLTWEEPAPEAPQVTLLVDGDRFAGFSGCNRYFATAQEPSPTELSLGALGGTRMACPAPEMELERRYLAALGGAFKYSFLAGKLALSYQEDEAFETLLFAPRAQSNDPEPPLP